MNKAHHLLRGTAVVVCSLVLLTGCNRREETSAGANAPGVTGPGMGSTGPGAAQSTVPGTTPSTTSSTSPSTVPSTAPGSTTAADASTPGMPSASASATEGTGMSGSTAGMTLPDAATSAGGSMGSPSSMASAPGAGSTTAGAMAGGPLAAADAKFVEKAAGGGLFEVAVGKLAADKASSADVKAFGSMLVEHHGAANEKLAQVAASHSVVLPTAVPADKQKIIDRLAGLSGTAFDRDFVKAVGIKDHQQDIADFEKASRSAKATDVRAFATETLPTLRSHLVAAQKLAPRGRGASAAS